MLRRYEFPNYFCLECVYMTEYFALNICLSLFQNPNTPNLISGIQDGMIFTNQLTEVSYT